MDGLVKALVENAKKNPYFNLEGYMERDWAVPFDDNAALNARIHKILRSDKDWHMHDHPFASISIVLEGGYWESMPAEQGQPPELDEEEFTIMWRGVGSVVRRAAHHRHKLTLPSGKTATSLFIMGPWEKDWGFYKPEGFVYWRDYLSDYTTVTSHDKPAGP